MTTATATGDRPAAAAKARGLCHRSAAGSQDEQLTKSEDPLVQNGDHPGVSGNPSWLRHRYGRTKSPATAGLTQLSVWPASWVPTILSRSTRWPRVFRTVCEREARRQVATGRQTWAEYVG
jgi:hypothetical protein